MYAVVMDLDVLLPFHRVDKYFKDAIDSLSNTQGVSFNVILIDDRLDKSVNILKMFSPLKNFIIVETEGQQGYGLALKAGTAHIKADSVALFNSDDLMHPLRFKKQLQKLENSDLNFTKMNRINSLSKQTISLAGEICSSNYDSIYLIFGSYGANATWCMKSTWWHENAFFDNKACLDWRIALNTFYKTNISFIQEYLYSYRKHDKQVTYEKNVSHSDMLPVLNAWNDFLATQNLPSYSFETFLSIGAPWITSSPLSKIEIKKFYMDVSNQLPAVSSEVANDVRSLIQKRMIFSLRAKSDISLKMWLAFNGKQQIPSITRDLLIRKLQRSK
jgi:glycosyltransferase involved in cell wall biosynthesis